MKLWRKLNTLRLLRSKNRDEGLGGGHITTRGIVRNENSCKSRLLLVNSNQ